MYTYDFLYTGEDLKWDTPSGCHFKSLPISRPAIQHPSDAYGPYRSLGELKCPILILQWCKLILIVKLLIQLKKIL